MSTSPFANIDEYIANSTPEVRPVLQNIRKIAQKAAPDAVETISYQLPAFRIKRTFFYFAAFKKHIGIYPPVKQDSDLIKELADYRNAKGNLAFPLSKPLPEKLIERVVKALAKEYGTPD